MVLISLVFSVTCLLTIIVCISRVSYLYGQIKSDDEWRVKYDKLYSTATAEILKAKGYSPIMNDIFPKTSDTRGGFKKIKPLEKIKKDKTDSSTSNNVGLRVVKPEEDNSDHKD